MNLDNVAKKRRNISLGGILLYCTLASFAVIWLSSIPEYNYISRTKRRKDKWLFFWGRALTAVVMSPLYVQSFGPKWPASAESEKEENSRNQ